MTSYLKSLKHEETYEKFWWWQSESFKHSQTWKQRQSQKNEKLYKYLKTLANDLGIFCKLYSLSKIGYNDPFRAIKLNKGQ